MGYAYRLQPAHRRRLRRMRELVDAADGSLTPDELAAAEEYLSIHASCEAYLDAQMTQTAPPERPRCAQGYGSVFRIRHEIPHYIRNHVCISLTACS